jgi:hypothetical protein
MGVAIPRFLGEQPVNQPLGRHLRSEGWGFDVPARDIEMASQLVTKVFADDTAELIAMVEGASGLDRSLFNGGALLPASPAPPRRH